MALTAHFSDAACILTARADRFVCVVCGALCFRLLCQGSPEPQPCGQARLLRLSHSEMVPWNGAGGGTPAEMVGVERQAGAHPVLWPPAFNR